ncbi:MAG: nucleotide sugar dehydrogenase [Clostridia bacterium]|nr:nucleotide sugar dehydrogenase [Clostridia bacterium]
MTLSEKIKKRERYIAVVGLGYVGLPLAVAFAEKGLKVIGFDISERRITELKKGYDPTEEVGDEAVKNSDILFTNEESELKKASFFVVTVPTPINFDHTPDLTPVISASTLIGRNLTEGSLVVYESTVYPGCTEDTCVPILEKESGLKCGTGFKVGYSPERINPGDKVHRLANIKKVVSGMDEESLADVKAVYDTIIEAGTYPVSNIRTAEAIKVAENSQRDVNIAFMNELAMVFDRMGIDSGEVADGMNTKWNALGFRPGLVGGHCIGVDPYYFTFQAERLGVHSTIVLGGRKVNDGMGYFVADAAVKKMREAGLEPKNVKTAVLGLTFKENCKDIRNTKVVDIVSRLKEYGIDAEVTDCCAEKEAAMREYGIPLKDIGEIKDCDCVIVAVAHSEYKQMGLSGLSKLFKKDGKRIFVDVKGIVPREEIKNSGFIWWRL